MSKPPPYTPPWPASALAPPLWSEDGVKRGSGARRPSLLRPSKARHPQDAARFANPVIQSYMHADSYSDYRGATYKARGAAARGSRVLPLR